MINTKVRLTIILGLVMLGLNLLASVCAAKTTITHFSFYFWDNPKLREAQRDAFYAKYGKDIEIQFQFEAYDVWMEKSAVMAQTGKLPDIIFSFWDTMRVAKNKIWDLEPFMKKSRASFANFKPGTEEMATFEDKMVSLPFTENNWMGDNYSAIIYNKNLFERAGVAYPKAKWTWDNYYQNAAKLTKDTNGDGKTDILGSDTWQSTVWFAKTNGYIHGEFANHVLTGYGSRLSGVDADYTKPIINSKDSVAAFNMIQKLIDLEPNPPFYPNYWENKVAMVSRNMVMGKDEIMKAASKFKSGVVLMPNGPKGSSYEATGIPAIDQPNGYYICSATKEKAEAAWKWIHFLVFEKEAIMAAKKTNTIPSLYDKRFLKEWQDSMEPELIKSGYAEWLLDVQEALEQNKTYGIESPIGLDMINDNVKILGKHFRGKIPLKQALEECEKKVQSYLDKNKAAISEARKERDRALAKLKKKK